MSSTLGPQVNWSTALWHHKKVIHVHIESHDPSALFLLNKTVIHGIDVFWRKSFLFVTLQEESSLPFKHVFILKRVGISTSRIVISSLTPSNSTILTMSWRIDHSSAVYLSLNFMLHTTHCKKITNNMFLLFLFLKMTS